MKQKSCLVLVLTVLNLACGAEAGVLSPPDSDASAGSGGSAGASGMGGAGGGGAAGTSGVAGSAGTAGSGACKEGAQQCVGTTPQKCNASGHWESGAPCSFVCSEGKCTGICAPGTKQCDELTPQTCGQNGEWKSDQPCPLVCSAGTCTGACSPGTAQCNGNWVQTCDTSGKWSNTTNCPYVCTDGKCAGVCTPGTGQCNSLIPQSCDKDGEWADGSPCDYLCTGGQCTGVCKPGGTQCSGNLLQTCQPDGKWDAGNACEGSTPLCQAGKCVARPSCQALSPTCGPTGNSDCCASTVVQGGKFNRLNDLNYPATVSDFRLDTYLVTVGRFRKFMASYPTNNPVAGAGKNPHNTDDPGWDNSWNSGMPATAAGLAAALKCNATFQTWTDSEGNNESRPIHCLSWFEAFAFCIWDGGRLPTLAEYNYAAAGGSEQREYPWSVPPGSTTITALHASYHDGTDCVGDGLPGCTVGDFTNVGSKPAGNAKWGQAAMAGDVWEWVLDWGHSPLPLPCTDCANFWPDPNRLAFGGSALDAASALRTSFAHGNSPAAHTNGYGVRCARDP